MIPEHKYNAYCYLRYHLLVDDILQIEADVRTEIFLFELNFSGIGKRLFQSFFLVGSIRADGYDTSSGCNDLTVLQGCSGMEYDAVSGFRIVNTCNRETFFVCFRIPS